MLVLFTDFGLAGPYQGQLKAVIYRRAPGIPVVDLFSDAPKADPRAAAYLLAAYAWEFPPGTVFLAVVDPGVGMKRNAVALRVAGRYFVGPDNGLFHALVAQAQRAEAWEIGWRPERLSSSFHGRDLFAPIAADLARGHWPEAMYPLDSAALRRDWPIDLPEVVYIDHFGNALTGLRASGVAKDQVLKINGTSMRYARTFGEVPAGTAFWYANGNGLVEVAVNQGNAAEEMNLKVGSPARVA